MTFGEPVMDASGLTEVSIRMLGPICAPSARTVSLVSDAESEGSGTWVASRSPAELPIASSFSSWYETPLTVSVTGLNLSASDSVTGVRAEVGSGFASSGFDWGGDLTASRKC